MKRTHKIVITLTIESTEDQAFDPKTHQNYEYIHADDEYLVEKLEQSLPALVVPGYLTTSLDVDSFVESELVLNEEEQQRAKIHSTQEEEEFRDNSSKLDDIARANGIKHAIWSGPATAADIHTKLIPGKVKFSYSTGWSNEHYESKVYENPSYIDAWKEFDKGIEHTEDFHHVFLESFLPLGMEGDVKLFDFSAGS